MNKVTVTLTEDQVTELLCLVGNRISMFESMKLGINRKQELAFLKRIRTTLAKAKS